MVKVVKRSLIRVKLILTLVFLAQLNLSPPHGKGVAHSVGVLHARLVVVNATTSVETNVKAATQDIKQLEIVSPADAADSATIAIADLTTGQSDLYGALGSLLSKLDVFVGIIDELSKVSK